MKAQKEARHKTGYVLTSTENGHMTIEGIYSTKEKAKRALNAHKKSLAAQIEYYGDNELSEALHSFGDTAFAAYFDDCRHIYMEIFKRTVDKQPADLLA